MNLTPGEIISLLGMLATWAGLWIVWKKLKPEVKKTNSEANHEDAEAADIFRRMAIDEALSKTQTVIEMKKNIETLSGIIITLQEDNKKLVATLASEHTARVSLESDIVRLNGELAEVKKERSDALAVLENLKLWGERFMSWVNSDTLLLEKLKELKIVPIPVSIDVSGRKRSL